MDTAVASLYTGWLDAVELAAMMEIGDLIEFRRVIGARDTKIYSVSAAGICIFSQHVPACIPYYLTPQ